MRRCTARGSIHSRQAARGVVTHSSGNHAQATAKKLGIKIPAIPVEHQYIVTEPDPALVSYREAGGGEHPVLRDADAKWYVREERGGWILGGAGAHRTATTRTNSRY